MTYTEKVKASKVVLEAIKGLGNGEKVVVSYGTDYYGRPKEYTIRCDVYNPSGPSYSIYPNDAWSFRGMNIDSLTNTQAKAYTYDMMSQRTSYNFPLYKMTIVEEKANDLEFVG